MPSQSHRIAHGMSQSSCRGPSEVSHSSHPFRIGETSFISTTLDFCRETRHLVNEATRTAVYLSFKESLHETCPLFLPRLREGTENSVDATEKGTKRMFDLDDVKELIECHIAIGHSNNDPSSARMKLIQNFQETWESLAITCIQEVQETLLDIILPIVPVYFGESFLPVVRSTIVTLLSHHQTLCKSFVRSLLDAERTPYTQNTGYFQVARNGWLSKHGQECTARGVASAMGYLTSTGPRAMRNGLQFEDGWVPLLSPGWVRWTETTLAHPYERELVIMAEVWAYFHISCERVADVVPMTVESKLVEKFLDNMQDVLLQPLMGNASDTETAL